MRTLVKCAVVAAAVLTTGCSGDSDGEAASTSVPSSEPAPPVDETSGEATVTVELTDYPVHQEGFDFGVRFIGPDGSLIAERTVGDGDFEERGEDVQTVEWTVEVVVPAGEVTVQSDLSRSAGPRAEPPQFEEPCARTFNVETDVPVTLRLDWDNGCLGT